MGNNPLLYVLLIVAVIAAFIIGASALAGLIVANVARRYSRVTIDRFIDEMEELLPKTSCGSCGCSNCREYAQKIFAGEIENNCPYIDDDAKAELESCSTRFQKLLDDPTPPKARKRPRVR